MGYSELLEKSREYRNILYKEGYRSKKTESFLFYKAIPEGCLFFDMRCSREEIEKSNKLSCSIWLKPNSNIKNWQANRIRNSEIRYLSNQGIDISSLIEEDAGYCTICKKDIQSDAPFCSKECKGVYRKRRKEERRIWEEQRINNLPICEICQKRIENYSQLSHHIKYDPEIIILVHRGCHNRVHRTDRYKELIKYSEDEKVQFYDQKKQPKVKPTPQPKKMSLKQIFARNNG